MLLKTLFPHLRHFRVDVLVKEEQQITLVCVSTRKQAPCPSCQQISRRIHSRYHRTLMDGSFSGQAVVLRLRVHTFFCQHTACPQHIFTERLPELCEPNGKQTHLRKQALEQIGLALAGQAGAKLATRVGMPVCGRTILRVLHALSLSLETSSPRIVGIDDWCWKRGRTYGSLLVDLERHQPIDLLPDRSVEIVKPWFQAHPGVQIVSRGGSAEYATAIRQGAPQALQVSDRFHIIQNVAKSVKLLLARCRDEIGSTQWRPLTPPHVQRAQQARRSQRLNQYQQVMALSKEGSKDAEMARRTQLSVRTVRRWRVHDSFPEVKRGPRRSRFDPYVLRRWQEGCTNGYQLWREVTRQGYRGSTRSVYNFLQPLSKGLLTPALQQELACFSAQETLWLFVRDPQDLDEKQRKSPGAVWQTNSTAKVAYQLVQAFMAMVHQRTGNLPDPWPEKRCPEPDRGVRQLYRWYRARQSRHGGKVDSDVQQWAGARTDDKAEIDQAISVWSDGVGFAQGPSPIYRRGWSRKEDYRGEPDGLMLSIWLKHNRVSRDDESKKDDDRTAQMSSVASDGTSLQPPQ